MTLPDAYNIGTEGWFGHDDTWPEVMDIAVFGWQDYTETDDTVSPMKAWPPF